MGSWDLDACRETHKESVKKTEGWAGRCKQVSKSDILGEQYFKE